MPQYIMTYRGGDKPATPEAGAAHMKKYQAWIAGLGDAAVNPATPLRGSRIVSKSAVSEQSDEASISGYTIVTADTIESAIEIAKACPFLDTNGTMQVAELIRMK